MHLKLNPPLDRSQLTDRPANSALLHTLDGRFGSGQVKNAGQLTITSDTMANTRLRRTP